MEKVTIVFKDGTQIKADVNGSTYIVSKKPTFPDDLTGITITAKDNEIVIQHGMITECPKPQGDKNYWFAIIAIPEEDINRDKIEAQVMFTALMTDTLMEEEEE